MYPHCDSPALVQALETAGYVVHTLMASRYPYEVCVTAYPYDVYVTAPGCLHAPGQPCRSPLRDVAKLMLQDPEDLPVSLATLGDCLDPLTLRILQDRLSGRLP